MRGVEAAERVSLTAGSARSKCACCPFAGLCTPCKPQTGELGKAKVSVVGSIEELFSKKSPGLRDGIFIFGPARQGSGELQMRTSEKTCPICQKSASTCGHSESKTSALKAA